MSIAHGNTKEITMSDFLDIFNHRAKNQPVLAFSEIKKEFLDRGTQMSDPTLTKKMKPFLYDDEENPSGIIMKTNSESLTTYYLKGEEMVYIDNQRKTLSDLIATSEIFLPMTMKVTAFFVAVSLMLRAGQSVGIVPQDLAIFEFLTLHPVLFAWVGGMVAGVSFLGGYVGKVGLEGIPLNERLDREYKAIPWKGNILKKVVKQFDNVAKLFGFDMRGLYDPRYIAWGCYMILISGWGIAVSPYGPFIQFSSEWILFGIIGGSYMVLMMSATAIFISSGVGAFFEARDWLKGGNEVKK